MVENKGVDNLNNLEVDDEDDDDTQKDRYLTFRILNEEYGIEIMYVNEIIGMYKITPVPEMPSYVKGVINLRGKVIPVIDVRLRFGMNQKEYDERTCIIVVNMEYLEVGLIVDTVNEVVQIPEEDIEKPSRLSQSRKSLFIKGLGKIGENVKILLDVNKLLHSDDIEQIAETASL